MIIFCKEMRSDFELIIFLATEKDIFFLWKVNAEPALDVSHYNPKWEVISGLWKTLPQALLPPSFLNPCLYVGSAFFLCLWSRSLAQPIAVWETCSFWLPSLAPTLYRLKGLELTGTYVVHKLTQVMENYDLGPKSRLLPDFVNSFIGVDFIL